MFVSYRIEELLNDSDTTLSREILEFAQNELRYVEEIASKMYWIGLRSLQEEIYLQTDDLVSKLEGAARCNFSKLKSESSSMEPEDLKLEIQSLVARVKNIGEEHADELYNPLPPQDEEDNDEEDDDIDVKMVGLSDQYYEIKERLLWRSEYLKVVPLVGMPGIGKTTLARKVFKDPEIVERYEVRIWVRVGGKCRLNQIPRRILARINPDCLVERDVSRHLREILTGKKCLIVLDDVWEKDVGHFLGELFLTRLFEESCGDPLRRQQINCSVLVTTRLQQHSKDFRLRLLDKEESWNLLREKVFGEKSYPTQFEKAGKKIAENCEGLPLTIITVADRLSKVKEVKYWDEVASKKNHKLFKDVYDEISKVLLPSYNFLPRLLQTCFLFMSVFPPNHEVRRSKLLSMWNVDGFLEQKVDFDALDCLEELVSNSLVMIYKNSSSEVGGKSIKTCGFHSSLWHLSSTEARKTKLCHVLSNRDDGFTADMIGQQRLSFHNNILCTIKDVFEFVEKNCAPTVRSLLYYGPYHPYQVPICFDLGMLRELDVLTIRFYEFPTEVVRLVELRYLTLTWDGKIPASISQLSNLRFLIVHRHFVVIKPSRDRYLPIEIWDMQELQHLQVMGSNLPHPRSWLLKNLSTLSGVSPCSCTDEVFKAIPNLKKLGIRIELGPNGDGIPLRCLDHTSHLGKLESLKCVIVNPNLILPCYNLTSFPPARKTRRLSKMGPKERNRYFYHHENVVMSPKIVSPIASITFLPLSLRKLSLSGLGFPWKEMRKIAALPNLEVLKLRNYAFTGPYWRVKKSEFRFLRTLLIEDSDLVEWSLERYCFWSITNLRLKNCYKYERMIGEFGHSISLTYIQFFACNPLGIQQMRENLSSRWMEWKIDSSLADGGNSTQ